MQNTRDASTGMGIKLILIKEGKMWKFSILTMKYYISKSIFYLHVSIFVCFCLRYINTEMKMIGELYSPDIALLPIGSVYTMDIDHAVLAAKWLNAKKVIPMHYNTFGAINVNIKEFEEKIKTQNIQPIILKSGEETIF